MRGRKAVHVGQAGGGGQGGAAAGKAGVAVAPDPELQKARGDHEGNGDADWPASSAPEERARVM